MFGWFRPEPFTLVSADHQISVGGRRESGVASIYKFKMVANFASEKMSIEDLWVDSAYFQVNPYKQNADLSFSNSWEKGDTIQFIVSFKTFPDSDIKMIKDNNGPLKILPKAYKGSALVGYKLKNKQRYFVVNKIVELQRQNMP